MIEINQFLDRLNCLFYLFITLLYFYNLIIYKIMTFKYSISFNLIIGIFVQI